MTKLAQKRKRLRLTQTAIANLFGISQQAYAMRERRGVRNVDMAFRYALRLGCRPEEILEIPRVAGKQ